MTIDKQEKMIRGKIKEAREKIAEAASVIANHANDENMPGAPSSIGAIEKEMATIQMHISHLHRLDGALAVTFTIQAQKFNEGNPNEQN